MTDLTALVAKLEAATEGSVSLDADIYEVLGYSVRRGYDTLPRTARGRHSPVVWRYWDEDGRWISMRNYTRYVDQAMHLLPERDALGNYWRVVLERKPVAVGPAWICTVRPHAGNGGSAIANTAPLALCIAALKARSLTND